MNKEAADFVKEYEDYVIPLSKEIHLSYFEATTTGDSAKYQKINGLELKLVKFLSDEKGFQKAKSFLDQGSTDVENRMLKLIYMDYFANQIPEELSGKIILLQNKIEEKFNTFRAKIDGKAVTDNDIDSILTNSTDSAELEKAYSASKEIGNTVENEVIELSKLRNEAAAKLGFDNFHQLKLYLNEQTTEELDQIFNQADAITTPVFEKIKSEEIDPFLADRFAVTAEKLMPWHYQNRFFQEAVNIYKVDLDKVYADQNLVGLVGKYFSSIDLPVEKIVERSDLFEKENKYQNAYCLDIDREGDIRIVCNLKPTLRWAGTLLHELGHAVYDLNVDPSLPWILREKAHIFTTEGVAMYFGRLANDRNWIKEFTGKEMASDEAIDSQKQLRLEKIVFSRWSQVMYRFEKGLYENPEQNLNELWWSLVEKYQLLKRPENWNQPHWASKTHIVSSPVYYHNYLLGDFYASLLAKKITDGNLSGKEVGQFFKQNVFASGAKYHWKEFVERSTGSPLTPDAFAEEHLK